MRMMILCVLAALPALAQSEASPPQAAAPAPAKDQTTPARPIDAGLAGRGERVYGRFCVSCHGEHGDGKGVSAPWLDPRPRDFTRGVFKWRSTPSGTLPTDEDLVRTVKRGLHHTNMPAWETIGDGNIRATVEYLKTFSALWKEQGPGKPIVVPAAPPDSDASRKRGAELYQSLGCFNCHGPRGRGDGPSAAELKDDWGYKSVPYDFTTGTGLKCGDRPEDVYRVFMTGLNGSPMPSFADSLTPEDAWSLVHYLRSLSGGPQAAR
jgi:mono/diheme cytochrome c family protein